MTARKGRERRTLRDGVKKERVSVQVDPVVFKRMMGVSFPLRRAEMYGVSLPTSGRDSFYEGPNHILVSPMPCSFDHAGHFWIRHWNESTEGMGNTGRWSYERTLNICNWRSAGQGHQCWTIATGGRSRAAKVGPRPCRHHEVLSG